MSQVTQHTTKTFIVRCETKEYSIEWNGDKHMIRWRQFNETHKYPFVPIGEFSMFDLKCIQQLVNCCIFNTLPTVITVDGKSCKVL